MEIFIREIITDDAEAVARLSNQLGYNISPAQTINNIKAILESNDSAAFVCLYENKVVGWINTACIVLIASEPFCEIRGLIVDGKYRKNNIGKMLMERAKQWCKEKNCERLRVRCNIKREDAHLFYQHLGFSEKKEQKVFEIDVSDTFFSLK